MNVAIVSTRIGTTVPTIFPSGVSPMTRLASVATPPAIVKITYMALLGAIALAAAIAFGLGGRDVAARMLESAYEAGRQNKDELRQNLEQGKERAREEARQARQDGRPTTAGATTRP